MGIDIGRIAYQAYYDKKTNMEAPHANLLLPWELLGQVEQNAWRSAASAVIEYIDEERETENRGLAFEKDIID